MGHLWCKTAFGRGFQLLIYVMGGVKIHHTPPKGGVKFEGSGSYVDYKILAKCYWVLQAI